MTLDETILRNLIYLRELALASGNVRKVAELNMVIETHKEKMKKACA